LIELTGRTYAAPWTDEDRAILLGVPWIMVETDKRDAETMLQGRLGAPMAPADPSRGTPRPG
jgi:hypothetical protein